MAIQSSTIRIYADSAKSTLVETVANPSSSTSVTVPQLAEGKAYWATAQIVDENNITSEESSVYQFYTLPNVDWASAQPLIATSDSISYQIDEITNGVTFTRIGIVYSTDSSFTTYDTYYESEQGSGTLTGLTEHTTYYVAPYLRDQFNREWINWDVDDSITTAYAVPTVTWSGIASVGTTTWSRGITVTSTDTVTAVTAHYQASGGSEQTASLTAGTGSQTVNLTGLTPGTTYSVWVTATNSAGSGSSSSVSFTTDSASISLDLALLSLDNATNQAGVRGTVTKDASVTLVSHVIYCYENELHSGSPLETYTQSTPSDSYTTSFVYLNPDETYYGFEYVTYTISGDATVYELWSDPREIVTYSLFSFGTITPSNTSATVVYSVSGDATSTTIEYSSDGSSWEVASVPSLTGGTATLTGLTPGTTYQLRGRVKNGVGWSGYDTDTFTTTADAGAVTITSISDVTPTTATVNFTVE